MNFSYRISLILWSLLMLTGSIWGMTLISCKNNDIYTYLRILMGTSTFIMTIMICSLFCINFCSYNDSTIGDIWLVIALITCSIIQVIIIGLINASIDSCASTDASNFKIYIGVVGGVGCSIILLNIFSKIFDYFRRARSIEDIPEYRVSSNLNTLNLEQITNNRTKIQDKIHWKEKQLQSIDDRLKSVNLPELRYISLLKEQRKIVSDINNLSSQLEGDTQMYYPPPKHLSNLPELPPTPPKSRRYPSEPTCFIAEVSALKNRGKDVNIDRKNLLTLMIQNKCHDNIITALKEQIQKYDISFDLDKFKVDVDAGIEIVKSPLDIHSSIRTKDNITVPIQNMQYEATPVLNYFSETPKTVPHTPPTLQHVFSDTPSNTPEFENFGHGTMGTPLFLSREPSKAKVPDIIPQPPREFPHRVVPPIPPIPPTPALPPRKQLAPSKQQVPIEVDL
jgi:hypothetical protein